MIVHGGAALRAAHAPAGASSTCGNLQGFGRQRCVFSEVAWFQPPLAGKDAHLRMGGPSWHRLPAKGPCRQPPAWSWSVPWRGCWRALRRRRWAGQMAGRAR